MWLADVLDGFWENMVQYPGRGLARLSSWYMAKKMTRPWWMP